ncbi:MAG: acetate kinase [Candidatus Parcubacteria bacterium]|jgi:acetate kinase
MGMERIIILSNIGSASKKYSVYQDDVEIGWFHFEPQDEGYILSFKIKNAFEKKFITEEHYINALVYIVELLKNNKVISDIQEIQAIGLRVVVPHIDFVQDVECTVEVIEKLKQFRESDPIHIDPALTEIQSIQNSFSSNIKLYIISDSSFHVSSKRRIPLMFEKPVYTIGYHGLSCESILSKLKEQNISHSKLISVHLGGGSSVTAIRNGVSVYNSMEFSPLDGILMSSRSGSIDPFAILLYMREKKLSYEQTLEDLYNKSGIFALSDGLSSDLRIVRENAFKGNSASKNAITQFVDSIASHICQAISHTQGIDTLVFTGTIGYRAYYIREMVIEKLAWLGCAIDHTDNMESNDVCFEISSFNSKIKIYVIQVDEMKEMHKHLQKILKK